ncbi:hypothetical protein K458DRAFT_392158 [Lentithecium fluviatile CBS 122367]|uniref:Uncharacterized protein n=1 Tax=Lentithecium fluviatile CBS 122367 TaxID=1168545 RepID=A0A6G1ISZ5_9PLEO|nr:hypothetical protein K458DRAFT_392158 [Lentithecium fluviatile CBS 122367]
MQFFTCLAAAFGLGGIYKNCGEPPTIERLEVVTYVTQYIAPTATVTDTVDLSPTLTEIFSPPTSFPAEPTANAATHHGDFVPGLKPFSIPVADTRSWFSAAAWLYWAGETVSDWIDDPPSYSFTVSINLWQGIGLLFFGFTACFMFNIFGLGDYCDPIGLRVFPKIWTATVTFSFNVCNTVIRFCKFLASLFIQLTSLSTLLISVCIYPVALGYISTTFCYISAFLIIFCNLANVSDNLRDFLTSCIPWWTLYSSISSSCLGWLHTVTPTACRLVRWTWITCLLPVCQFIWICLLDPIVRAIVRNIKRHFQDLWGFLFAQYTRVLYLWLGLLLFSQKLFQERDTPFDPDRKLAQQAYATSPQELMRIMRQNDELYVQIRTEISAANNAKYYQPKLFTGFGSLSTGASAHGLFPLETRERNRMYRERMIYAF